LSSPSSIGGARRLAAEPVWTWPVGYRGGTAVRRHELSADRLNRPGARTGPRLAKAPSAV